MAELKSFCSFLVLVFVMQSSVLSFAGMKDANEDGEGYGTRALAAFFQSVGSHFITRKVVTPLNLKSDFKPKVSREYVLRSLPK